MLTSTLSMAIDFQSQNPGRQMNLLYIILDCIVLVGFVAILIWKKRYRALGFGAFGGVIFMIADFGIWYTIQGNRHIDFITQNGNVPVSTAVAFWFLLWFSFSYGLTTFGWIWLWLDKDKFLKEFSAYILAGWFGVALASQALAENTLYLYRDVNKQHGFMGLVFLLGYILVVIYNLTDKNEKERVPIYRIMLIGIVVHFSWEFIIYITGIRIDGATGGNALQSTIVNSLLETNMGMPYIYLIYKVVSRFLDKRKSVKSE